MTKIALIGNPNSGKSTFFNAVTNAKEHVGNWHGVTVDFVEKKFVLNGEELVLVDLPGTYSLSPYSIEEEVTRDYLISQKDIKAINIIDGNNIERNLFLTLELIEMGLRPVVLINMANELKKNGTKIDLTMLKKMLGLEVFLIDAQNKRQAKEVVEYFCDNETQYHKNLPKYCDGINDYFDSLHLHFIKKNLNIFEKIKILEQDEYFISKLNLSKDDKKQLIDTLSQQKTLEKIVSIRFDFIKKIISNCVSFGTQKVYGFCGFDRFALSRFFSIPIFLFVIGMVFFITFGPIGSFLSSTFSSFFESVFLSPLITFVQNNTSNLFVSDFVSGAIGGSIVSLISFLPQVVLMYLGLFVLEDTGYISRIAFSFDDHLQKVGLSGKSIFALLMSFGCSTTATLASRNMENQNSKIKTAMLTPYVSCSAKLPLYAVVCGAFFPNHKSLIVFCLYLLGIIVAIIMSAVFNKTVLKSKDTNFLMELPKYRIPSFSKLLKNVLSNTKQFLLRAGTVLLSFSCIIWIVQNCNFKFQYGVGDSMLTTISEFLSPVFSPIGFGCSGAVSALICGVVAKEIIVSTIGIINGLVGTSTLFDISSSLLVSTSAFHLTQASALSFLVFALLYLPCASTISVMSKEIGGKWTFFACVCQFLMAYATSYVVFKVSSYFFQNGFWGGLLSLFVFSLICFAIFCVLKIFKKRKFCKFCPKRKSCGTFRQ